MEIVFRKGQSADLDEICGLVSNAGAELRKKGIDQWDSVYPCREDFRRDIAAGQLTVGLVQGRIALVYVLNDECDGQYENGKWARPDGPYRVVHRLCVRSSFQRQGLGRLAMERIIGEAAQLGAESLRLDAFCQNPYSLRLYTHLGFRVTGYAHWRKGTFCLMEKVLRP